MKTPSLYSGIDINSAKALIESANNKRLMSVIFDDEYHIHYNGNKTYQAMLLGANLIEGELLISTLHPMPTIHEKVFFKDKSFWLKIKNPEGYIFVEVMTLEIGTDDSIVKILNVFMSHNQRWQTRASFAARTGPAIEIRPANAPLQKGWLRNVSCDGGLLELYGMDTKNMLHKNEQLNAHFIFSNDFTPTWRIHIVEVNFLRKPCCYLSARFKFDSGRSHTERHQIRDFVDGFNNQQYVA